MTTQRGILVAGNWKMNGSVALAEELAAAVAGFTPPDDVEVLLMPPFPYLERVADRLQAIDHCALGAQDVSAHDNGAYTGEVSASMLAELGVRYVLVGHSERRQLHDEDDARVAAKFARAQEAGLTPVLCVGETEAQREAGQTGAVVGRQVGAVIEACGMQALDNAVIAYEPVWAIGTGRTASVAQAAEVHRQIRSLLAGHDATIAGRIRIVYGGSMKPDNAAELLACDEIDGGLIGGASLQADSFLAIAAAA
ncbi:MAG: triose-phosphate isomerase [Wenzhouxiangellaceae bacterium]|nr:triose-phosphate isomerase [Wenzhouxiangellaceae bacterium]